MKQGAYSRFVAALESHGSYQDGKKWRCPSHDDSKNSLSVNEAADGTVLVKCWAGCDTESVCKSLGLSLSALFARTGALKARGMVLGGVSYSRVDCYEYLDETGKKLHWNERYEPKFFIQGRYDPAGRRIWGMSAAWHVYKKNGWVAIKDAGGRAAYVDRTVRPEIDGAEWFDTPRVVLWRLPRLVRARESGIPIWLVDGEKDVKTLERFGEVATCRPKGRAEWCKAWTEMLRGVGDEYEVVIVRDIDKADSLGADGRNRRGFSGQRTAKKIAEALQSAGIPVRMVQAASGKDATDHFDAGYSFDDFVPVADWGDFEATSPATSSSVVPLTVLEGGGSGGGSGRAGGSGEHGEAQFPLTDSGNAKRLLSLHEGDLRYCARLASWAVWSGHVWRMDEAAESDVFERSLTMVTDLLAAVGKNWTFSEDEKEDASLRARTVRLVKGFQNANRLNNLESLARRCAGVPILPEVFDRRQDILTVQNGTIDLRTGEFVEPRREDFVTKFIDIPYDPDAECPVFTKFVDRCCTGDAEMKRFINKAAGYSLTGERKEQKFFFLYGEGQTGKSTFVNALESVMGPYAGILKPAHLTAKKFGDEGVPAEFARLRGQRFVKVPEWDDGMTMDESTIKILTGENKTMARFMRENWFDVEITFKFWMYGNRQPTIRSTDRAMRRRVLMVEWSQTVSPEDCDQELESKLLAERAGILAWCVRGARLWYAEGLSAPRQVVDATDEYFEDMDQIGQYLAEFCLIDSESSYQSSKLYNVYKNWSKRNNQFTMSSVKFARALKEKGFENRRGAGHARWYGLALKPEFEDQGELGE